MNRMISFFLINLLFTSILSCDRYLMNSVNPEFGRGIYAGKNFRENDIVEISPSLLIKNTFAMENQLQYFVYATDDDVYDAIVFGEGMMYNSLDTENLAHEWNENKLPGFDTLYDEPYTTYTSFKYTAEDNIRLGEELFVNYGKEWFEQRSKRPITSSEVVKRRYSLKDLEKYGFCLSDTYVSPSSLPLAGNGLFSKKAYKKDDLVMLSPVLVLPKKDLELTIDSSLLINYCITSNGSDVALLPISVGGMINHGGKSSNVEITWHMIEDTESFLAQSPKNLSQLNYAPLSIKYVAKRPILIGEEITVNYGIEWEKEWIEHLHNLKNWNEKYSDYGHFLKPQFRKMIEAPKGMFPSHFYEDNFNSDRSKNNNKNKKNYQQFKIDQRNKYEEAINHASLNFNTNINLEQCSETVAK